MSAVCVATTLTARFEKRFTTCAKLGSSTRWQLRLLAGDGSPVRTCLGSSRPGSASPVVLTAVAKSSTSETSNGINKVSPDVLKLFGETQRNLLELNRNRLEALDELRVAKSKISELETQLDQANTQASAVSESPVTTAEPTQQDAADDKKDVTPAQPTGTQAAPAVITVSYTTGWSQAMMHYSADGQAWSGLPGVRMTDGQDEFADSKVLQVRGTRLEFVLTNGDGQWDSPNPYNTDGVNKNYVIDAPGRYTLTSGVITKIA